MSYRKIIIGLCVAVFVSFFGYVYLKIASKSQTINNDNPNIITSFHYNNVKIGGDFTLNKHDGTDFTFSDIKGKPSLIYFGFTHCPDFCPASLQIMDAVAKNIDVNRIFISVDPARDTIKQLSNYVSLYKEGLIALTGTVSDIDKVTKKWNVYYSINKQSDTDKNYLVDHTTYLYVTDKNGHVIALVRPEATYQEIVAFLQKNQ